MIVGPGRSRSAAKLGVGLYVGVVNVESLRVRRQAPARVVAGLSAIFATLHGSWGVGFLLGLMCFGSLRSLLRTQLSRASRRRIRTVDRPEVTQKKR